MEIRILTPVFNDWHSCSVLIQNVSKLFSADNSVHYSFIVVDDGSTEEAPEGFTSQNVRIVHLNRNIGHQRAIVLGLCHIQEHEPCDYVIVMDADGEDKPDDIIRLLDSAKQQQNNIIFGKRQRRVESLWFRFFYFWYKVMFRLLTGKQINFGNFCVIPSARLKTLIYVSELWNHFSGGIIRSRIPYSTIPLDRGKRYSGKSKMNFISLIIHGLSGISIYTDAVAVRILVTTFTAIMIAAIGIFIVAGIRFFTPFAIPGWASFVTLGFLIIIFQAFLISVLMIFSVLSYRTQRHFIPALEYKDFIRNIK